MTKYRRMLFAKRKPIDWYTVGIVLVIVLVLAVKIK